ncbi:hypothetical protein [Actinoplanes sp. NPDC049802]|uniref:hypothetical protein n=1 Tax=Actinoplanes sp. NPDC049802 TaxID=3154742 RepID=UPI0033D977C9
MSEISPFEFPTDRKPAPGLGDRVRELADAGRLRSALDLVLGTLRREPGDPDAMAYGLVVLSMSREERKAAAEPVTRRQEASALLAPIATECGECGRFWYSSQVLLEEARGYFDPVGIQCPVCRCTRCADCMNVPDLGDTDLDCPSPGCAGRLGGYLRPTGRRGVVAVDPDDIERIIVGRDGPILPDFGEALDTVSEYVPILPEDGPLILRCRVGPDAMHARTYRPAEHPPGEVFTSMVRRLEAEMLLSPGAAARSTCLCLADRGGDGNWYVTVVTSPPPPARGEEHARETRLLRAHLARLHREYPGEAAPAREALSTDHLVNLTADLLVQARRDAARSGAPALRMRLAGWCVVAVTAVPASGPGAAREFFPDGYERYVEWLAGAWNLPDPGLSLAHWIDCSDALDERLHLSFLPADTHERAWLASDLIDPA